jgi:membrane protease subunit (stomatin/prohibitin family)
MEKGGEGGGGNDMMKTMLQMQMAQQMMQNINNPSAHNTNSAAQGQQTKEQILATLKELGDLKAAGILTEEEFNAKKQELLSRL